MCTESGVGLADSPGSLQQIWDHPASSDAPSRVAALTRPCGGGGEVENVWRGAGSRSEREARGLKLPNPLLSGRRRWRLLIPSLTSAATGRMELCLMQIERGDSRRYNVCVYMCVCVHV